MVGSLPLTNLQKDHSQESCKIFCLEGEWLLILEQNKKIFTRESKFSITPRLLKNHLFDMETRSPQLLLLGKPRHELNYSEGTVGNRIKRIKGMSGSGMVRVNENEDMPAPRCG